MVKAIWVFGRISKKNPSVNFSLTIVGYLYTCIRTYIHTSIHPYIHTYPLIYPQSPFVLPIKWLVLPPLSPMKQPDPIAIGTGRVDLQPGWVCSDWTDGIQYQWYARRNPRYLLDQIPRIFRGGERKLLSGNMFDYHKVYLPPSTCWLIKSRPSLTSRSRNLQKTLDIYWVHGFKANKPTSIGCHPFFAH